MLVKMMLSSDDLKTWPHHPSSLHHPPCHATAPRVGLLYRVMALVQDSIYHDATDFCGRGGRKMDELLLTWSKWIIEGRQGSNLAPTKWLICPFDGNLGRSRPTRIPDQSQQFSPFNASTNTISAPDALMPCYQPHRSFHLQLPAQRSHSEITQAVVGIVGNCCSPLWVIVLLEKNQVLRPKHIPANAQNNPGPATSSKILDLCEDKHH